MGLLDSNKVKTLEIRKNGNFSLSLSSSAVQNEIMFNGAAYNGMKLIVSGIASGADVLIIARTGVSTAAVATMYDANGNKLSNITTNGTYYVDCSGSSFVDFKVTRTIQSGTASVDYSLFQDKLDFQLINKITGSISGTKNIGVSYEEETFDLSEVANIKTFTNNGEYGCLCVDVKSISDGASIGFLKSVGYSGFGIYNSNGAIFSRIEASGRYYVVCDINSVIMRVYTAVSGGTMVASCSFIKDLPNGIAELRPIQRIGTFTAEITSTDAITLVSYNNTEIRNLMTKFKYFYYSYFLSNSGGTGVIRTCHISVQPYHYYNGTYKPGKEKELSVDNGYSYQSEWFEINGQALNIYVQNESRSEGDTIVFNIYGVR